MIGSAVIDPTGRYRYVLRRHFERGMLFATKRVRVAWIMLNPSTADANVDDATIRRVARFSSDWGFLSLSVVNLFAYRATDPAELFEVDDPIGPENDAHIDREVSEAQLVVCAWGVHGALRRRDEQVRSRLAGAGVTLHVLDLTGGGMPHHPLRLRADAQPYPWKWRA